MSQETESRVTVTMPKEEYDILVHNNDILGKVSESLSRKECTILTCGVLQVKGYMQYFILNYDKTIANLVEEQSRLKTERDYLQKMVNEYDLKEMRKLRPMSKKWYQFWK